MPHRIVRSVLAGALLACSLQGVSFGGQCASGGAWDDAAEDRRKLFSVSTDEESASTSLNRVAGEYDTGYARGKQTYQSKNHSTPSPFSREKEATKAD